MKKKELAGYGAIAGAAAGYLLQANRDAAIDAKYGAGTAAKGGGGALLSHNQEMGLNVVIGSVLGAGLGWLFGKKR